ncbi:MAG: tetratricopeptide repeat protein [Bacteroidales bacterium]|nr:tetratricopeptide repeat protein [Bacteroidales bacterium]MCF8404959.1 tetratricopeptide repeat protein [Bacteroidales bacterium]
MKHNQTRAIFFFVVIFIISSCNQKSPTYHFKNGLAKYNLKDYTGAIKDLDQAISLKDDQAEAYYCRAICFIETNEPDKALLDF